MMTRRTKVIFHVTRTLYCFWIYVTFELAENTVQALAHDVGQNVEATAMRHPDDCRIQSGVGSMRQNLIEYRHRTFSTFNAESLSAHIFCG